MAATNTKNLLFWFRIRESTTECDMPVHVQECLTSGEPASAVLHVFLSWSATRFSRPSGEAITCDAAGAIDAVAGD